MPSAPRRENSATASLHPVDIEYRQPPQPPNSDEPIGRRRPPWSVTVGCWPDEGLKHSCAVLRGCVVGVGGEAKECDDCHIRGAANGHELKTAVSQEETIAKDDRADSVCSCLKLSCQSPLSVGVEPEKQKRSLPANVTRLEVDPVEALALWVPLFGPEVDENLTDAVAARHAPEPALQ